MFRLLIIASLIAAWGLWFIGVHKKAGDESGVPLAVRYDNSQYFQKVVGRDLFLQAAERAPAAAGFAVGLDPTASPYAIFRWSLIAILGWLYFCFISAFPKPILTHGISRLDLFFLPPTLVFLLSLLTALGVLVRNYHAVAGKTLIFATGALQIMVIGTTILIGLFAIPVSIGLWVSRMVRPGKNEPKEPGKAELPGPVVKRKQIDGVWYDE